ncbi:MAG: hypothetical protein ACI4S3_06080 [Candidatus Gastranaerophilaceae bacterium]
MGKTFDQSLIDTAVISMSMIDPEDIADTSSEEFTSLRRIQQGCHSELCNRKDFPFKEHNKTIKTKIGQSEYANPDGTIVSLWVKGNTKQMTYDKNIRLLREAKGNPTTYGVNSNDKIVLYPTPDKVYDVDITYNSTKNVIDTDGNYSYTITIGSTLDMPERVQHLYFDALEYRVLFEYMRKVTNPRLDETEQLFESKWQAFLDASRTVDSETYFTI